MRDSNSPTFFQELHNAVPLFIMTAPVWFVIASFWMPQGHYLKESFLVTTGDPLYRFLFLGSWMLSTLIVVRDIIRELSSPDALDTTRYLKRLLKNTLIFLCSYAWFLLFIAAISVATWFLMDGQATGMNWVSNLIFILLYIDLLSQMGILDGTPKGRERIRDLFVLLGFVGTVLGLHAFMVQFIDSGKNSRDWLALAYAFQTTIHGLLAYIFSEGMEALMRRIGPHAWPYVNQFRAEYLGKKYLSREESS